MTIGQLSARTGLPVRTLRFYADAGLLPEAARSESGYRLFDSDAVPRARLVRTLRELGVGLDDVKRVLTAEATLQAVAAAHAGALEAQIRVVAAWVELVELLRNPDYVETSRRMADRARSEGAAPDDGHVGVEAVGEHAGAAVRSGVDPGSREALAVIERVEALTSGGGDRAQMAERLEVFTDRRAFRYWTLVGIVNGWPQPPVSEASADAWEWYAKALRAHAGAPPSR